MIALIEIAIFAVGAVVWLVATVAFIHWAWLLGRPHKTYRMEFPPDFSEDIDRARRHAKMLRKEIPQESYSTDSPSNSFIEAFVEANEYKSDIEPHDGR